MKTKDYRKGLYSIIQYIPDLGRMEAANVGVLLLIPDIKFLAVLVDESNIRVQRFFPETDLERLDVAKQAVCFRLQHLDPTLEQVQAYIDTRANALRMTNLHPIKVEGNPDQCILRLMGELVYKAT